MTTTLRQAVISLLEADATLMAILTGGVYDRREISRALTPAAYSATTGALKPCAVVTISTTTPETIPDRPFEQVVFQVWLYEEPGNHYAAIGPAADRVRALLHTKTVAITGTGAVHEIRHADGLGDSFDESLRAEMTYERFWAWRYRA